MTLQLTSMDIAIRLALTIVAAGIVGFNRGARGHVVGLRTTILVGLAASVAMIQTNILLGVDGKTASSFATMDVMRLPLGILTGVGFIGGGAILRRGDLVTGVTTAATLWAISVIGLCFGGGQLGLGSAATALTFLTLSVLQWLEKYFPRDNYGSLVIGAAVADRTPPELQLLIAPLGYDAQFRSSTTDAERGSVATFDIRWTGHESGGRPFELLATVERHYRVISFERHDEERH